MSMSAAEWYSRHTKRPLDYVATGNRRFGRVLHIAAERAVAPHALAPGLVVVLCGESLWQHQGVQHWEDPSDSPIPMCRRCVKRAPDDA